MNDVARKIIDLADIRADGWFEQLGEDIADFEQLCQVMGRRFVAFSFIASVRISAIAYDPQAPHTSLVDFSIGDSEEMQRMTLADLRERLGSALLSPDESPEPLDNDPRTEEIRQYIGRRYLLLAPIFGIRLESLELGGSEPLLHLDLGHRSEVVGATGLRDLLHNAIRSEVARVRPNQPFSIDFKKVPLAEAANDEGNYDETIALLGAWPGPLSMFLRTPQGQALGPTERSKLVRALGALGEAYVYKGQADWAEDVLRLGIQFGQELAASAPLFGILGRTRVSARRYGEAIGLLRRALALGGDEAEILPELARSFAARGRHVAAMACIDRALACGADPLNTEALAASAREALGDAYLRLHEYLESEPD
ncbi:MAG: hypothetical protein OEZ06_00290 [Myxococcales bacterium]|nr:hypothetical protein [Myxococcales bacterium]